MEEEEAAGRPVRFMREATLRRELHIAAEAAEALALEVRMRRGGGQTVGKDVEAELEDRLSEQEERRSSMQRALRSTAARERPEIVKMKSWRSRTCWERFMASTFLAVLKNSLNGFLVVWLYNTAGWNGCP